MVWSQYLQRVAQIPAPLFTLALAELIIIWERMNTPTLMRRAFITMNHSKTINIIGDIVSRYDQAEGEKIKSLINKSRIYREIYSYKFPANGLKEIGLLQ